LLANVEKQQILCKKTAVYRTTAICVVKQTTL